MEEDAGVQVAAPGAHHDAAGRREPHGGIERLTVVHRRQAGTVAQMRDHQATLGCRAEGRHDVFIGQPMKAVPSYAFVPEVAGQGEALRHLRHTAVKGGVKTRHLWQPGEARRHRLDALDGTRQVQGRKGDQPAQRGEERRIHALRGRMVRAAMDHPMPHGDRGRQAQVRGRHEYAFGRRRMAQGNRGGHRPVPRCPCPGPRGVHRPDRCAPPRRGRAAPLPRLRGDRGRTSRKRSRC